MTLYQAMHLMIGAASLAVAILALRGKDKK
ncbi:putative holin-like toxin [Metabacillus sp. GX 13764]|nr:putative holin-like toxin [Metabacillus kandeliae]MCD7034096.1 putative holin-like toxin [Metabacillus kandeliae]